MSYISPLQRISGLACVVYAAINNRVIRSRSDGVNQTNLMPHSMGGDPPVVAAWDQDYYTISNVSPTDYAVIEGPSTTVYTYNDATANTYLAGIAASDNYRFVAVGSTDSNTPAMIKRLNASWQSEITLANLPAVMQVNGLAANDDCVAISSFMSGAGYGNAETHLYTHAGAHITTITHATGGTYVWQPCATDEGRLFVLYQSGGAAPAGLRQLVSEYDSSTGAHIQTLVVSDDYTTKEYSGLAVNRGALFLFNEDNGYIDVWDRDLVFDEYGNITTDTFTNNSKQWQAYQGSSPLGGHLAIMRGPGRSC